jgi:hypothetical protein
MVVVLLVLKHQAVLGLRQLLLPVRVDKELVVPLLGVLLKLLVLFGDRPLPPVFTGRGLQLVVPQLMLLPLLLLLSLWEPQLSGLARAMLLVFVPVLMGTDICNSSLLRPPPPCVSGCGRCSYPLPCPTSSPSLVLCVRRGWTYGHRHAST